MLESCHLNVWGIDVPCGQWRIQKISEGMAVYRRGRPSWSKNGFHSLFEAVQPLFSSFLLRKNGKKISREGGGGRVAEGLDPPVLVVFKSNLSEIENKI